MGTHKNINDFLAELGSRIKERRLALNISESELASKVCISVNYLNKIENEGKDIPAHMLFEIKKILGVTFEYLLEGEVTLPEE
ncbi:MAG: helix-turn-helix domain-containing protein [Oscillospiraceae bacterium]|nr:helix-turn-helix domain-containing protein [Oscillospiraceae bacterium]